MRKFEVGQTYDAVLNGENRYFIVVRDGSKNWGRDGEYLIRWDDGDEEWAYIADMERWIMEADPIYRKEGRGGKREGAGRPSIGIAKPFKLTLEQEAWDWIDECVKSGRAASRADLIRQLIDQARN